MDGDLIGERLADGRVQKLDQMPAALAQAVADVAVTLGLTADWLNVGPASLMDLGLPDGFEGRLRPLRYRSLTLWLAGSLDMVCFKLYAAADEWPTQGRHMQDLRALRPGRDEIDQAAAWCVTHGSSRAIALMLDGVLDELRRPHESA